MTETDSQKIALGVLLLGVSTLLVLGSGTGLLSGALPIGVAALGSLGLAAGALLVGTSNQGRPV